MEDHQYSPQNKSEVIREATNQQELLRSFGCINVHFLANPKPYRF